MRKTLRTAVVGFASIGLVLGEAGLARAHETGAIRLASKTVSVGGDLVLSGVKLGKSGVIKLQLRGTLDNYDVGQVRTDTAGAFQARLTLPPLVPAGAYTLVAIAPDGDVSARTELSVSAGSAPAAAAPAMPGMKMSDGRTMAPMAGMMNGEHATAEMMSIPTTTSPGEWAVIAAAIIGGAAGGLFLLRRASRLMAADRDAIV